MAPWSAPSAGQLGAPSSARGVQCILSPLRNCSVVRMHSAASTPSALPICRGTAACQERQNMTFVSQDQRIFQPSSSCGVQRALRWLLNVQADQEQAQVPAGSTCEAVLATRLNKL